MARVQFGGSVIQLNGSIAGNTFQRNSSGNIVRARIVPAVPQSNLMAKTQNTSVSLTNIWQNEDLGTQETWIYLASTIDRQNRYGRHIKVSGFQLFKSCNSIRVLLGLPVLISAPSYILPPTFGDFEVSLDYTYMSIYTDQAAVPADTSYILYATNLLNSFKPFNTAGQKQICVIPSGSTFPFEAASYWAAKYKTTWPPPHGSHVYISFQMCAANHNTGLVTPYAYTANELY